jgi:hypothetical protein
MAYLPSTYTGIPIISVSPEGAKHLCQELQDNPPQTTLPIDLEATHLTERLGKYVVITPMADYKVIRALVSRLLDLRSAFYMSEKFDTPPVLQASRKAPTSKPEDDVSQDAFCDLHSVASSHQDGNSLAGTTSAWARRQQMLTAAPPFDRGDKMCGRQNYQT